MKKNIVQSIKDFVFFPIRALFSHETVEKLGLTSIRQERFNVCLPYLRDKVLDIGCGPGNKFIKKLGRGIGLDPYFSKNADVVAGAEKMPFADKEFQTITIMVTLRLVEDKLAALKESHRVLTDDGFLLILENHPFLNSFRQALLWWDPCIGKGLKAKQGLTKKEIVSLAESSGFKLVKRVRYIYGLSLMYILAKKDYENR